MKVKEESEKVGLKLNIQKTKIIASSSITSWWIDEEAMETVRDFILGGSKISADGDCSHEIKRHLFLWRKVLTNLESILKIRDITLPTKVHLLKAMIFPVVTYGCESWTIKKAEHRRIDAFELWCGEDSWEFLGLQGDPTSQTKRKSVLNNHWKDWCWSWSSNTLATWWEELTPWKRPRYWERLKAGREGDNRGWGGWMASPTWWTWVSASSGSWWWTGKPSMLQSMGLQRVRHDWAAWTELKVFLPFLSAEQLTNSAYGLQGLFFVTVLSCSVESDSLWPHGVYPARLPCPWDSLGKNTGVGCHAIYMQISIL